MIELKLTMEEFFTFDFLCKKDNVSYQHISFDNKRSFHNVKVKKEFAERYNY